MLTFAGHRGRACCASSPPGARATGACVRLALVVALGIPLQAVIGGITVLTDLNPWVVALHLLLSMADHRSAWSCSRSCGAVPHRDESGLRRAVRDRAASPDSGLGGVRRRLGRALPRHRRDRGGPARRRRRARRATGWTRGRLARPRGRGLRAGRADRGAAAPGPPGRGAWVARATAWPARRRAAAGRRRVHAVLLDLPDALVALHVLGAALSSAALAWVVVGARRTPG